VNFVRNYKIEIVILLGLIVSYFTLRLPNLTVQPIFADEAIYIRWAQVIRSEPTLRFLPLSDGKTPLFMWVMIPFFKIISDPLAAGRFLSVISGFFTLLGVFFLTQKVFSKQAAFWASLIYITSPFTVFFDRMALVDSLQSAFTVWIIYIAILLVRKMRLDLAMILGYLLGGAVLTKTPAIVSILILPISILGFKKIETDKYRLIKLILLWIVAIIIALGMYNLLRLGPNFHLLSSRNADYVFSPLELAGRPLDPFIPHFHDISDWFPRFFTWPILILIAFGTVKMIGEGNREGWVVALWALIPILLSMAFLKTFTARYLLTSVAPLLVFAGFGAQKLLQLIKIKQVSQKLKYLMLILVVMFLPLRFDYQLIKNSPPSDLPKEEKKGYFEDWTAGYGLKEIAQYLIDQKNSGPVVVGTEGYFGTLPDGLYIYLDKSQISVVGSSATISGKLRDSVKDHQTFFVGNKIDLVKGAKDLKLIMEFPKVRSSETGLQDATVLYEVLPER